METDLFNFFSFIFPQFRISKMFFGVTRLWIESSLTSGAEHSSAHPNLLYPVQGEGGGLCCRGMQLKRLWRPLNSRLLIHCHIMDHLGQKEPEKMMHVLKFTAFPEMCGTDLGQNTMLIFSNQCLFNLDSLLGKNMQRCSFLCRLLICSWSVLWPQRAFSETSTWLLVPCLAVSCVQLIVEARL